MGAAPKVLLLSPIAPDGPVARSDALESPTALVRRTLWQCRGAMAQAIVAAVIANGLVIALPLFMMTVYDRVVPHLAMETLWALVIGVSFALGLDLCLKLVRASLLDHASTRASLRLQSSLFDHVLAMNFSDRPANPALVGQLGRDVERLSQIAPALIIAVGIDLPFFFVMLTVLYLIGGLVVTAPIVAIALLIATGIFSRWLSAGHDRRSTETAQAISGLAMESVIALGWLKTCLAEREMAARWRALCDEAAYATGQSRFWNHAYTQASGFVLQATAVGVIVIGVYQLAAGEMTVGAMVASTILAGRAMAPVSQMIALLQRGAQLRIGLAELNRLVTAPKEPRPAISAPPIKRLTGSISLRNICARYPDAPADVVSDLSLSVGAGEKIALIGRNGAGKSTLLRLLVRLIEPRAGAMLLDGHDARQFAPDLLRRQIAYAPQDAVLLRGSLRDNLLLGLEDVDEQQFERVLRITGVAAFAGQHANGFGLQVGPRGENLSTGERQAVVLARALMSDAPIVLLDEPTAHLDHTRELRLVADLAPLLVGRTLVVATHRASALTLVDRVLWFDCGRVVKDAPRGEVMATLTGQQDGSAAAR